MDVVPHYWDILDFLDLRAQPSEPSIPGPIKKQLVTPGKKFGKTVTSFTASADSGGRHCVVCTSERHPLHVCPRFKRMSHEDRRSTVKKNKLCLNYLSGGHFIKQCRSSHKCKRCQRPHHTLLHVDREGDANPISLQPTGPAETPVVPSWVVLNTAVKLRSSSLLMTCQVIVFAPDGSSVQARALLDNTSSASFVSERLAQCLRLPRAHQSVRVSGIAGSSPNHSMHSIASFQISPVYHSGKKINLTAVVVPKVTCDLPVYPVPFDSAWSHISGIPLADPAFGQPGQVDMLFGVDIFVDVLGQGRRVGPPGTPVAVETEFGWVLSGSTDKSVFPQQDSPQVTALHTSAVCDDDVLRRFWEVEESPMNTPALSPEERAVVHHFEMNHSRTKEGRFIVPLPQRADTKPLGESRSQAVRRFLALECSLKRKNRFQELDAVMQEYLTLGHAEVVPLEDMEKDPTEVFYLPMHVVYKSSSSSTKVRAVFDASAKSSSGVSLNDTLLVGPTVHSTLIDVILRFRAHRVALTADVSKMYRAIELAPSDRDFHRFVWRSGPDRILMDYRMTRATFRVSASCFAANMAVKQNANELAQEYPLAAETVNQSFYVDDGLTSADDVDTAVVLQRQLQDLFARGGFVLRKWNSSEPSVLQAIPPELCELK